MAANQGDVWKINGEDRAKHDAQFFQLKPINGFITGNQARDFFMQSGLPTQVLGQIWGLADINGDGKMDKKEFSVAMHLIKKKLQGYALPKVLPASLKADPSPFIGSLGQSGMGMNFSMGASPSPMVGGMAMPGTSMPLIQPQAPQASLGTSTMTTGSLGGVPRMANGGSVQGTMGGSPMPMGTGAQPAAIPGGIWAMPHSNKLKHTQTFNAHDRNKRGYLLGVEGRSLLMQSGLPQPVLAQIWTLSDVDQDGKLTCDEYCIAMHLAELARMGQAMPSTLPAELIPTKARSGSITSPPPATPKKDAFGDLLGGMDLPKAPTPVMVPANQPMEELTLEEQVTFEDRRKENFDKGQAELDKRRALLREQQQQEANARFEKEKQEVAKRERQRLEAESKRQAELQRQLEKQRQKEREIEEQRRKMLEQREAARRDLDRRRQMEWETQRKEQLLQEKRKEYEQLSVLKTQMANLKAELESLDGKKTELSLKITQVQAGVADFTSSIDGMRVSRDRALADIDLYNRQSKELERKTYMLESEKDTLNIQVQTAQATPLSDTHRTVTHSVELKRTGIEKLKKDVEQLESDTEARLGEIDCNNAELKNLKDQLSRLTVELPKLKKQQDDRSAQQKKVSEELQQKQRQEKERQEKLKKEIEQQQQKAQQAPVSIPTSSEPNWFDFNSSEAGTGVTSSTAGSSASSGMDWDSAFSGTNSSSIYGNVSNTWGTNGATTLTGSSQKIKFKALYDFVATREDELSFSHGQEIMVMNEDPIAGMEDWYKGELNSDIGWFPKAYVEKVETPQPVAFGSAFEPVTQSSSSSQNQSNDLFSSNFTKESSAIVPPSNAGSVDVGVSLVSQESSDSLLAKATYPWKARQESDLTFDKDDVILVQKQEEMRWFGQLNGKSGWFPKAYVKLIGVAPKTESDQVDLESNHLGLSNKDSLGSSQMDGLEGGGGEYYVAMYTYTSDEPTDLTFNEGDMIMLNSKNGDWWTGSIPEQGRSGIFPANYVKKMDIQPSGTGQLAPEGSKPATGLESGDPFSQTPTTGSGDLFGGMLDFGVVSSGAKTMPVSTPANALNNLASREPMGGGLTSPPASDQNLFGLTSSSKDNTSLGGGSNSVSTTSVTTDSVMSAFDADPFGNMDSAFGDDPFGNEGKVSRSDPFDDAGKVSGSGDSTLDVVTSGANDLASLEPMGGGLTSPPASDQNLFGLTSSSKDTTMEDPFSSLGGGSNSVSTTSVATDSMMSALDPFGNMDSAFGDDPFGNEGKVSRSDPFGNAGKVSGSGDSTLGKMSFGNDDEITKAFENPPNEKSVFGDDPFGNVWSSSSGLGNDLLDGFGTATVTDTRSKSAFGAADIPALDLNSGKSKSLDNLDDVMPFEESGSVFGMGGNKGKNSEKPGLGTSVSISVQDDPSTGVQDRPEPKSAKKPEIARVIAPYVATGTGQLSLETGNLINVRQKSPRGWWEGELQVRGQKKKIGWFPANYVKLLGAGSARSTPEPSAMLAVGGSHNSRSATPQSIASQDGVTGINQPETVVALYAYQAQNEDELTFQKDAVITVLSRDNPDWWNGQLEGVTGVFPSNYVTPNPQSQSWMNDNVQEEMTKSERKRQQVIQELISTEESYNSDMLVALEVFKKPMIESNALPVEEVNQIFVNWEELIVCNKKLLQALRVRKKMSGKNGVIHIIGDLLCESIPHMNPYMRFCSCQLNAAAALQRAAENSTSFQEFHKMSMQNPKVKGVHLSGFLLRPMQRITRYPLLIEKILAHTPPEHADRGNVEESLSLAQELCSQVNQCVKEKQNSDHLEWIQTHVHCDGLAENIAFNSLTNCLGPRRLLFTGILYKVKSNKELVGFLFNDIFLLAQTSRPLGTNFSSLHLFDTNMQFKMYRLPIFLNEVSVKKCHDEAEPCQFQITSDRILNLKAVSSIERETWVRELENASKMYRDKARGKLERAHSAMRANPMGRVLVVVEEGVGLWCPDGAVKRPNVGRILVVIQEAAQLKPSNANGKSDPYCEVSMGSQEHRTKVIAGTLNPRWNASMQFFIRDVERDTLCFTVYDRDLFSPNDFLGRTEVRIKDVLDENGGEKRGPITKRLILHEVETGEVIVKLDLQLYES